MIHTIHLMENSLKTGHTQKLELRTSKSDIEKFKKSVGNDTNYSNLEIVEKH